ncbi:hypothetical protein AMJ44_10360 [candidate division WOR-1 bacterium DG_54_3]|uniref:Uncharacterized protein n=1 Tax=candidate division WOR-1 bacterium DG_54_3 TaxID=1703775 RepID=A0A0S7XSE2_UNCSA|nr:MAG: hypothetical protein AMJ44_10360 [candidate division WOR-1 bacterium DG_54_3]
MRKRLGNTQEGIFFWKTRILSARGGSAFSRKLSRRLSVFFDPSVIKIIKSQLKIRLNSYKSLKEIQVTFSQ